MPNSSTVSGVSPTISGSKNLMPCTQERGRDLQVGVCMDVRVCVCACARLRVCLLALLAQDYCWWKQRCCSLQDRHHRAIVSDLKRWKAGEERPAGPFGRCLMDPANTVTKWPLYQHSDTMASLPTQ